MIRTTIRVTTSVGSFGCVSDLVPVRLAAPEAAAADPDPLPEETPVPGLDFFDPAVAGSVVDVAAGVLPFCVVAVRRVPVAGDEVVLGAFAPSLAAGVVVEEGGFAGFFAGETPVLPGAVVVPVPPPFAGLTAGFAGGVVPPAFPPPLVPPLPPDAAGETVVLGATASPPVLADGAVTTGAAT
jgi:hypothetical protein